jgi:hypothetical protein
MTIGQPSSYERMPTQTPAFLHWPFQVILTAAYLSIGFGAGYFWAHRGTASLPSASCFDVSEARLMPPTNKLTGDPQCIINSCIVGVVSNTCDRAFRAVFLDFNLLDSSDVQVDSADGDVQNLQPHGKARFTAAIVGNPKIKKFKLVHIAVEQ